MLSRQSCCCAGVEPLLFARHLSKNPPPSSSQPACALTAAFPFAGLLHEYWGLLARLNRFKLGTPLIEAATRHAKLFGQLINTRAILHAPYGVVLKLPGITLSSLHSFFLSRRVCPSKLCQFKGSFQSLPPVDLRPKLLPLWGDLDKGGCQYRNQTGLTTQQVILFWSYWQGAPSCKKWPPHNSRLNVSP